MSGQEFDIQKQYIELKYSCLQLAKEILLYRSSSGEINPEEIMELATKYYNWIKNN